MARPPLPLGQHAAISVTSKNGRWIARCRVRGFDGVTRHVQKSGKSRTAARLALQNELRTLRGERAEVLRRDPRFRDAATIYLGKVTARREDSTTDVYSYWLEKPPYARAGARWRPTRSPMPPSWRVPPRRSPSRRPGRGPSWPAR